MERTVRPELLDQLPEDDPEARRSRRDIARVNAIMGNYHWLIRRMKAAEARGSLRWLEVGSGDGALVRFGGSIFEDVGGIDLVPRPQNWPDRWDWIQSDAAEALATLPVTNRSAVMVSVLTLHHLGSEALQSLGAHVANHCSGLIVAEPARFRRFQWLGACLSPFLNRVTRHDLPVSIAAGFRPGELPGLLGLGPDWVVTECVTPLGAYRFEAWRK